MELKKQVCDLELAKRLRDLGVKQESIFAWCQNPAPMDEYYLADQVWTDDHPQLRDKIAAFTVAELGEMLPNYFKHEQRGYVNLVMMRLDDGRSEVMYKEFTDVAFVGRADTEADARAKMLVYLWRTRLIELMR